MSFSETVVLSICTAFMAALFTWLGHLLVAFLQRGNEKVKYFRERLLERYSEFVSLALTEVERAKDLEAHLTLWGQNADQSELLRLLEKRQALHLDLRRISMQIRLFESDKSLSMGIEEIAKNQPRLPPNWGQTNYLEQFEKYRLDILAFEQKLTELVDKILLKHSSKVNKIIV